MPSLLPDFPSYFITLGLFVLFLLAFLVSPLSKHWENIFFKIAVAGFWAWVTIWLIDLILRAFVD